MTQQIGHILSFIRLGFRVEFQKKSLQIESTGLALTSYIAFIQSLSQHPYPKTTSTRREMAELDLLGS